MKNVLIVDDEKSFLLSLKDGLSVHRDSFQVLTAANGREAVAVLRAVPIDLLVTDLKLPEMDGFELLAWVSRHQPQLPVIVMTAFGTPEIEARLASHDTLQYLEKPLDLSVLQDGIFNGLNAGRKSYIRGITLSTFLQLMSIEQKNCTLKISAGGQVGYLYIRRGKLLDAEFGSLQGEAAALEIVGWDNAEIEMDGICRRQEEAIDISLEHVLIEAFRLKDERALEQKNGSASDPQSPAEKDLAADDDFFSASNEMEQPARRPLSPDERARKRLVNILAKQSAVQEYALFDQHGFLEEKNSGLCSLEEFAPENYLQLLEAIGRPLSLGSFSYVVFNTSRRVRYLLLRCLQHLVLVKLKPGTQPAPLVLEIKRFVNR